MKKYINVVALCIAAILTCVLEFLMNNNKLEINSRIIGGIIFFIINYIVLIFLIKALKELFKILGLKGKKLNSYSYFLYPVTLIIGFITLNMFLFRIAKYFLPQNLMVCGVVTTIVLLVLSQIGGAFPEYKRADDRKKALRLEAVGGKLGGFDVLGSLTGQYEDGIIIGTHAIPKSILKSMHRSEDSIVIEGLEKGKKSEIIILADKAKKYFIDLLAKDLNMPETEVKSGYHVKEVKSSDIHFKNRQQRRQEKRNK